LGTYAVTRDSTGDFFGGGYATVYPVTSGAYQTQHTPAMCPLANDTPATIPCNTGFVAKFSPSGSLIWGTYLGATVDEGDEVFGIAVDLGGNVWVDGFA